MTLTVEQRELWIRRVATNDIYRPVVEGVLERHQGEHQLGRLASPPRPAQHVARERIPRRRAPQEMAPEVVAWKGARGWLGDGGGLGAGQERWADAAVVEVALQRELHARARLREA